MTGISPDTALGRIVSIRAEDNEDVLKNFTKVVVMCSERKDK